MPAHGRLRVWPDAVAHQEGEGATRPPLVADWEKCYVDLTDGSLLVAPRPLPLVAVYLLHPEHDGPPPQVERLRGVDAVPLLAANSYRNDLLNAKMRAQEFVCLTQLVTNVPVSRLRYAAGLTQLSAVCDRVELDVPLRAS